MSTQRTADDPKTRQAYQALRQRIQMMSPGVPLPPVPELMEELSVGRLTLDKVYQQLERQGHIDRKRRKGVFVSDRLATGEIAIVLNGDLMEPDTSPAYGLACSRLRGKLHDINPEWAVKLHLGSGSVKGWELPATLDLLEPTVLPRLRGVLSFHPLHALEVKLAAVGVPVVYLGADVVPWGNGIFLDGEQILCEGIRHLAAAGCQNVSLLHPRSTLETEPHLDAETRIAAAASTAAECGLRFRNEYFDIGVGNWTQRHGYDLFMRIWQNADRPDGVMVADDILCHGVLRAILQLGLELPRDLRLVTQASRGIELPYHRPVSRMEYNLDEWVDKAVHMLDACVRSRPPGNSIERVRAMWIKGETA